MKGRPGQRPRRHTVPLARLGARELAGVKRVGDYVFSIDDGVQSIHGFTLSGWAAQVAGNQIAGFQLKRARSGVETLLAVNRLSREIRGHVQSHGLTGIQARHHDGHD